MSVYKLRYDSYERDGLIASRQDELLSDDYDLNTNASVIAVHYQGELVSTIRLAYLTACTPLSATFTSFQDVLIEHIKDGETILDGSRFAVANASRKYTKLAYLYTLRLAVLAAEEAHARWGVASVRSSHLEFYKRYGDFSLAEGPRSYPKMIEPQCLIKVDYWHSRERIISRSPDFKADKGEMPAIFGSKIS